MLKNTRASLALSTALFVAGFFLGSVFQPTSAVRAQAGKRVFEIRTYTTLDGRLDALHARFRNHTTRLFEKHGMTNIGYWSPQDAPLSQNTLIYVLAYPDREAAKKSWQGFRNDPEWKKVAAESEKDGKIVAKVDSVFMDPTDYSPMK